MKRENLSILVESALDMGKDSHGGNISSESMTWENMAGVLSKLSPQASAYARIKYLLEGRLVDALARSLYKQGVGITNRFKRRVHPQKLVETALLESIGDNICKSCNGVGYIRQEICPKCQKIGRRGWSNVKRAQMLNVSSSNWKRDYSLMYIEALQIFHKFEDQLGTALYLSKN